MVVHYRKRVICERRVNGKGLVDRIINNLPFEFHLPGYQFCGPGTKLQNRLNRGEKGVNPLDAACREHDIAYSANKNIDKRHQADKKLLEKAWERVKAKDSSLGEKLSSYIVTNAMKAKVKFGMGLKKKKQCGSSLFRTTLTNAMRVLKKEKPTDLNTAIRVARKTINKSLRGKKTKVIIPRIINVPKVGGFLPLVPILSALGALGALTSGGAAVAKAINVAKNGRRQLEESKRHNRTIEAIAVGKGLYLKPYKKGYGIFVNKEAKN